MQGRNFEKEMVQPTDIPETENQKSVSPIL